MPFVNIRVTKEGVTAAQKLALIEGATDLLTRVLNKNPAATFVIIDEVETDNWGLNRENITTLRQRAAGGGNPGGAR
ncbi:MAG: 4-oxalocrotonate tautomerase family protein [Pseudomonadota bacterium]